MLKYLAIYLNDHLAGSTAGLALAKRAAKANRGTPLGDTLEQLAHEISEDRAELMALMAELGVPRNHYKSALAGLGERFGHLKTNGRLFSRSPLSSLVELESLSLGIEGKASLWRSLAAAGIHSRSRDLEELQRRAESQRRRLEAHRGEAARAAVSRSSARPDHGRSAPHPG